MTGEMTQADLADWPLHKKVARALRSRLRPFDQYVGPYIAHKKGRVWISSDDGFAGEVCVWPHGLPPAQCEPIVEGYAPLSDAAEALAAARRALRRVK